MTRPPAVSPRRGVIWAHLIIVPGLTAYEIARAALRLAGPTGGHIGTGSVLGLLKRMERDGQVTRRDEYRPQQGATVSLWYAVPGAFAVADDDSAVAS